MDRATYLDRYLAGEHETVWQELLALGPAIRDEPLAADAHAVVQEALRRARHNIALIIARLQTLEYRFVSDLPRPEFNPAQIVQDTIAQATEQLGQPLSPELLTALDQLQAQVTEQYPILVDDLRQRAAQSRGEQGKSADPPPTDPVWRQPDDELRAQVATLRDRYGPLPLVLELWFEIVGEVDLCGVHPKLSRYIEYARESQQGPHGDPLLVACLTFADEFDPYYQDDDDPRIPDRLEIAPDECHKSNYSGGAALAVPIPTPDLDARLISDDQWNGMYIIEYLRLAFQYGGFPGLHYNAEARAVARDELAVLTQDLLPL